MLRGFYAAASGMMAQQRRQEMLTNNIANANTPGFKEDRASVRAFPEMLISRMGGTELPNNRRIGTHKVLGELNTGAYLQEATPNYKMGPIKETGNQTDIALLDVNVPFNEEANTNGALFFEVQNANGEPSYTRNGNFTLDQAGYLTTTDGFYVVDNNGNQIQILGNEFTVREDGMVLEDGFAVSQINVAFAEDPNALVKEGNGLFALEGGGVLPTAIGNEEVNYKLKQGFIESSNVDIEQTMTEMMMAYRNFEVNQKILKAYDESMEKAANQIGSLR